MEEFVGCLSADTGQWTRHLSLTRKIRLLAARVYETKITIHRRTSEDIVLFSNCVSSIESELWELQSWIWLFELLFVGGYPQSKEQY